MNIVQVYTVHAVNFTYFWKYRVLIVTAVKDFFSMRGFDFTIALFPDGPLKNAAHTSPGNTVGLNQSVDDFKTPKVFPKVC